MQLIEVFTFFKKMHDMNWEGLGVLICNDPILLLQKLWESFRERKADFEWKFCNEFKNLEDFQMLEWNIREGGILQVSMQTGLFGLNLSSVLLLQLSDQ